MTGNENSMTWPELNAAIAEAEGRVRELHEIRDQRNQTDRVAALERRTVPPARDEQLERLINQVQHLVGAIDSNTVELQEVSTKLTQLLDEGIQVKQ